ncbi:hypothetical protein JKF63_00629 [Porcisia hertigi]|uniref:Uncharacterized protein n=1 Tax=Porcisia hertigi TaxID=2761500 RepID=A0A836HFF8_9TRYP|nr:hypothetical protein JKF63_00629 [Porcisia hertigi]
MRPVGHSVGDEARQRNGIAVQKMFHRSNAQRLHAGAQISCGRDERATVGTTGDRYDGREATGMSFRVPRTSAAALVGIVGGAGRGEQPAWSNPDPCRNPTRAPLGVSSCLTDQIDLAEHMDTQPSAQPQLLSTRAAPLRMKERNGASRSCFLLGVQKARHAHGIEAMPADSALTRYEANKAQWKAYHHQQAILRYERTLPRRRVVDPYVHLTGAQVSVSLAVPNAYTADRLVERNGGRWILDNSHRQQLYKGAPVMTRIMQGEFYHQGAERRAAGVPRYDLLAKNRRDVRVTSAVNQAERQRRQSLPCHCICSK